MATYQVNTTFEITIDVEFTAECDGLAAEVKTAIENRLQEIIDSVNVIMDADTFTVTDVAHAGWTFDRIEED